MVWQHRCGWTGDASELVPAWHDGIVYAFTCPRCDDEWPFFYDEDCPQPDHELPPAVSRHADQATRRMLDEAEK